MEFETELETDEIITADPGSRRLIVPLGSIQASWIWGSADTWIALVGVRDGLNLLVTPPDPDDVVQGKATGIPPHLKTGPWRDKVRIEAWAGQPDDSDGIAVLGREGVAEAIARVPLCGCGVRGCGNSGIQLDKRIWPSELFQIVDRLRHLPWSTTGLTHENVLQGGELGLHGQEERARQDHAIASWVRSNRGRHTNTSARRRRQWSAAVPPNDPRVKRRQIEDGLRADALAFHRVPPPTNRTSR